MPQTAVAALASLRKLANKEKAKILQRFFKTGPGQYGAGDKFFGITVPQTRELARQYRDLSLTEIKKLLASPVHESRLLALMILVLRFPKASVAEQKQIFNFYLSVTARVNNWDLVDLSAPQIVGGYLASRDRKILRCLACSRSLWERRVAIVSTFYFIRRNEFSPTLDIARRLLGDPQDLIHKAAGWMLREVGKRDRKAAGSFLRRHCRRMPRTMLRYAIERFPEKTRRRYLNAKN